MSEWLPLDLWAPLQYSCPHSSTLAWKIPWMEEPGRLQSMGSLRVGHDWATSLSLFTFMHWRRKWQPTPVFLPRESQGRGILVGCRLWMGSHRVGHDWSDSAAKQLKPIYKWWLPRGWRTEVKSLSHVWLFATPWTVAHQAPPSMGFSRQEYWSGLPFPSPGDLPNPGMEPVSLALQTLYHLSHQRNLGGRG